MISSMIACILYNRPALKPTSWNINQEIVYRRTPWPLLSHNGCVLQTLMSMNHFTVENLHARVHSIFFFRLSYFFFFRLMTSAYIRIKYGIIYCTKHQLWGNVARSQNNLKTYCLKKKMYGQLELMDWLDQ